MSVVNLVILLVNAACVVVQEDAVAEVHLDFVGAQVMGEEVIVLVGAPLDAAVFHLMVAAATAGHHLLTVPVRRCLILMEMALGKGAEAEVDFKFGNCN